MNDFKTPNYDMIIKSLLGQLSRANLKIAELEATLAPKYQNNAEQANETPDKKKER